MIIDFQHEASSSAMNYVKFNFSQNQQKFRAHHTPPFHRSIQLEQMLKNTQVLSFVAMLLAPKSMQMRKIRVNIHCDLLKMNGKMR